MIIELILCVSLVYASPTGGTITTDGSYTVHTFFSNGTFDTSGLTLNTSVLLVGGGGGSGYAGGGGAGGYIYNVSYVISGSLSVVVGSGGLGVDYDTSGVNGTNGGNSSFGNFTAKGGGAGGLQAKVGFDGGSGGGSGFAGAVNGGLGYLNQGMSGGNTTTTGSPWPNTGGGGANGTGGNAVGSQSGNGGVGINNSINGSIVCYAGGGGGGAETTSVLPGNGSCGGGNGAPTGGGNGVDGKNGTGGGGGGCYNAGGSLGGDGGKGIVIIRYLTPTTGNFTLNFLNQTPSNVTVSTVFTQVVNVTYNYSLANLTSPIILNFTTYHNGGCYLMVNGSCQVANNTMRSINQSSNSSTASFSSMSFSLNENDVLPRISNLNFTHYNGSSYNLNNANSFIATGLLNLSLNETYNILEIAGLSSLNNSHVYACNSSYSFSNSPIGNGGCLEIGLLKSIVNHSNDQLVPFNIVGGSINGVLGISQETFFIVQGANVGINNVSYVNNYTRQGAVRTTTNSFTTYTNQTYTTLVHLHQLNNDEYLKYFAIGNYSKILQTSTIQTEQIDLINLNPSPPIITNPLSTTQNTRYLNITYLNATSNVIGASISYYNISLLNSDLTFNQTIQGNNSVNNSYYLDVYNLNLSINNYFIKVEAVDTVGYKSYDLESFNLTTNVLLNVTAWNLTTNQINVFNVSVVDLNNSNSYFNSTSGGIIYFDLVKGDSYNIIFMSSGYITRNITYVANQSSFQNLNISTAPPNSFTVYVFAENGGSLITQNDTIVLTDIVNLNQYSYNFTSGILFVSGLNPGNYSLFVISNGSISYAPRYYNLVINGDYQIVNTYLALTANTVLFNTKTTAGTPLSGVLVQQMTNINGSVKIIQSSLSDISGKAQFSYVPYTLYMFNASLVDYQNVSFILNPVLFSSYDIALSPLVQGVIVPTAYVSFSPVSFYKGQNDSYNFSITSTYNGLTSYYYNVSFPTYLISHSGTNLNGESFGDIFNLSNASSGQTVTLYYQYVLSNGVSYNQTIVYQINIPLYNKTLYSLGQDQTFGFQVGDRIFIVVIIDLVCFGVGFAVFGPIGGLGLAFLNNSIFAVVGFVPWFMFYASIVIALLFIFGQGVDNG